MDELLLPQPPMWDKGSPTALSTRGPRIPILQADPNLHGGVG